MKNNIYREAVGLLSNDTELEKEVISLIKQTYQKHGGVTSDSDWREVDMSSMDDGDWQEVIKKIESAALSCWLTDGQKKVQLDFLDDELAAGLKEMKKLITGIEKLKLNDKTSKLAKALTKDYAGPQKVIDDTLKGLAEIKGFIEQDPNDQLNLTKGRPSNPAKPEFATRVYSILFDTFGETPPVWQNEVGLVSPFVKLLDLLYSKLVSKLGIPVGNRVSSFSVARETRAIFINKLESNEN